MMKPIHAAILYVSLLVSGANAQHAGHPPPAVAASPYMGMEKRAIKALSSSQIEDLKAGRGMGLALAAELNGYPGPLHVLELAEPLHLAPEQIAWMRSLIADMKQETSVIGGEVIKAEAALDALFARTQATPETLAMLVRNIAEAQGRLRASHLRYHLDTRGALSPAQIEHYARLRGYLQRLGFRWVEALIITLLGVIAVCFAIQIALADPNWGAVIKGFAPTTEIVTNPEMLYLALGILGATVMPHNLYLHSGIVQTRAYGDTLPEKREALKFATIDSTVALMFALLVNASILILAAATFNKTGQTNVAELGEAHKLLAPLLGLAIAPTLFGIALLCCGINSTVTATLAGQIVMEGFLDIKLPPWLRRLITRAIAIVPAAIVTIWYGDSGTAKLLILTQVVLSLQLSFAVFPLIMFTADKRKMGALVAPFWLIAFAALIGVVIAILNVKLLVDFIIGG